MLHIAYAIYVHVSVDLRIALTYLQGEKAIRLIIFIHLNTCSRKLSQFLMLLSLC